MIFEEDKPNTGVHTQKHVQERNYEKHELKITLRRLIRTFQPNLRKIMSVDFIIFYCPYLSCFKLKKGQIDQI